MIPRRGYLIPFAAGLVLIALAAHARDVDGRYAQSPLKGWFDNLKSGRGLCCSTSDGTAVADPDWETLNGRYRVRIEGVWHDVPPEALVTVPNLYGRAMVWPLGGEVRCFMPGPLT